MMEELFLTAALALPALHANLLSEYWLLKVYLESRIPDYTIVYVHKDEKLLTPGAEDTHLFVRDRRTGEAMQRVWAIKRSA